MKINQKYLDEHVQEMLNDALKQFKEWDDPEDIFDENINAYVLMVETLASDDRGIYQPDKILSDLEPYVIGLDKKIEDARKEIAEEEGEEYDEDHPPKISWEESEIVDLVDNASNIISEALNVHPVVKNAKLEFSFGNSEGSGDWGLFASMDPAAFKTLRKSGKQLTGSKGKKTTNIASKTTTKATSAKKGEAPKKFTEEQANAAVSKYLNESERYEAYAKQKGISDEESITYFIKNGYKLLEKIPSSYKTLVKAVHDQMKMLRKRAIE